MVGSGELPRLCNHNPRGYVVELDGCIRVLVCTTT